MLKRMERICSLCLLVSMLALLAAPIMAVDPLPEEIENAPLDVREAYINQQAEESLQRKIEVGKKRYEERQEKKKEWAQHLRATADVRREELRQEMAAREREIDRSENAVRISLAVTVLLIAVGSAGYGIHRVMAPGSRTP
ncbi:hypothetical protein KQI84_06380 [bacterium]|nr:hypothetical protein [bacterium]